MSPTDTVPDTVHRRSGRERALLWLEASLALGAYAGAVGFLVGGIDVGDAAARLPFSSLPFAGVALGLVNGVFPTVVLVAALRRQPWARIGHLAVGLTLVAWIVVQVAILGPPVHVLQGIYLSLGWLIAALAVRELSSHDAQAR